MNLKKLIETYPNLQEYLQNMPEDIEKICSIKTLPPGKIIHQKNYELDYFAFICSGEHRVINEMANGNIYIIERNSPIDFVGEVTILAGLDKTSVTLETVTESTLLYIPRKEFEKWLLNDIDLLRLISKKVAFKLYRSSLENGTKLFYPPSFILLDFLIKYCNRHNIKECDGLTIPFTRQQLSEELGLNLKTLNRTLKKLKEEDLIGSQKGKLHITIEQFLLCKEEIQTLQ